MKSQPGDVIVPEASLLLEAKVYATVEMSGEKHFPLNLDWLWKIIKEAERIGYRNAAVVIRGKGLQNRAVVLAYEDYLELLRDAESFRVKV